jgi:hypothetical protein
MVGKWLGYGAHRRGGGNNGFGGAPAAGPVTPCVDKQQSEVTHREVEVEGKEK